MGESIKSKTDELESAKKSMDLEMAQMQEQHCIEIEKEKKNRQKIKNELGWNEKEVESLVSKTDELESAKQNMDLEMAQMQEQHRIEIENEKKNHQKIKNELGWNEKEIESIVSKTNELESAKQNMDQDMAQMQEQHHLKMENEKAIHFRTKEELDKEFADHNATKSELIEERTGHNATAEELEQ